MEQQEIDCLTAQQLANKMQVSLLTIRRWTARNRLPGVIRVGRLVRYKATEIEKAILRGKLLKTGVSV